MLRTFDFVTRSTDGLEKCWQFINTGSSLRKRRYRRFIWLRSNGRAINWNVFFAELAKTPKNTFFRKIKGSAQGCVKNILTTTPPGYGAYDVLHSSGPTLSIRWQSAKNMILGHFLTSDVIVKSHYSAGFAIWLIGLMKLFSLGH